MLHRDMFLCFAQEKNLFGASFGEKNMKSLEQVFQ